MMTYEFGNWEWIKERLVMQATAATGNDDYLATVPHRNVLDMAIIYRIYLGCAGIVVTNIMLECWEKTEEELFHYAKQNRELAICSLGDLLPEGMNIEEQNEIPNMFIARYKGLDMFGSGVIAYPELFGEAKKLYPDGFYILPSSIHEVLIVNGKFDEEAMLSLVCEVNQAHVAPNDRLTDNAYRFNSEKDQLVEVA